MHETLVTRNQCLQDRNSNYEQSHETSLRQLARKDRQLEELREELRKAKFKTAAAEDAARAASTNEAIWRDEAHRAKSLASQKEIEYEAIVACRNDDNARHQGGIEKARQDFETLRRQREEDLEKVKKLEIIAEQQRQTIAFLEDLTKKLNANFKSYREEIDTAVADMHHHFRSNDTAIAQKLEDMTRVAGEMRWVMRMEELINGQPRRPSSPTKQHLR